jgi:cytochrome P450 family 710 subfamily A protein
MTHVLHVWSLRSAERREDVTYAGNYLVFGHGPHYCVGKEYAINHLITFLAILSTSLDWTRFRYST